MGWDVIAGLVLQYGVPFVTHIIENAQNNKPVTLDEWNALVAKIQISGESLIPKRPS